MKEQINKFVLNIATYAMAIVLTMYEITFHYSAGIFNEHARVSFLIIIDFIVKLNLVYLVLCLLKLIYSMLKERQERKKK